MTENVRFVVDPWVTRDVVNAFEHTRCRNGEFRTSFGRILIEDETLCENAICALVHWLGKTFLYALHSACADAKKKTTWARECKLRAALGRIYPQADGTRPMVERLNMADASSLSYTLFCASTVARGGSGHAPHLLMGATLGASIKQLRKELAYQEAVVLMIDGIAVALTEVLRENDHVLTKILMAQVGTRRADSIPHDIEDRNVRTALRLVFAELLQTCPPEEKRARGFLEDAAGWTRHWNRFAMDHVDPRNSLTDEEFDATIHVSKA